MFDALVFIGRFQPFHEGHLYVIAQALKKTHHVIILIGSANRPRSVQNPFTFDERQVMIEQSIYQRLRLTHTQKITFIPIYDVLYNDNLWLQNVQRAVQNVLRDKQKIGIIGHDKDDSSYYLKLFPTWAFVPLPSFEHLSATPLRTQYLADGTIERQQLPQASYDFLMAFKQTCAYTYLQAELDHIKAYQDSYAALPYPPIFQTTDALVVQSGHVLVVRRKGAYGCGQLALPGGFLDAHETLRRCVVRELKEETGLDLSHMTPTNQRTFDRPSRSARARTITTVFFFALTGDTLPVVTAGDDAQNAFWLPLSELSGRDFFEDHYGIVCAMLGLNGDIPISTHDITITAQT